MTKQRDRKKMLGVWAEPKPEIPPAISLVGGTAVAEDIHAAEPADDDWMTHTAAAKAHAPGSVFALTSLLTRRIEDTSPEFDSLKQKLESGENVVELDTALIDPSFVSDRIDISETEIDELAAQIAQRGQLVPILVRPHPDQNLRYQVAFGHRRLRAAIKLGRAVRAIVRKLSDEELVVAQGQENNARLDLTFIEKVRFASELEKQGFTRDLIGAAISTGANNVSTMLTMYRRFPEQVVLAIGKAPGVGRPRWLELQQALGERKNTAKAEAFIGTERFQKLASEDRFAALLKELAQVDQSAKQAAPKPTYWSDTKGRQLAAINLSPEQCVLRIDRKVEPGFAEFVVGKLSELYTQYETENA